MPVVKTVTTCVATVKDDNLAQVLTDVEGMMHQGWKLAGPIQMLDGDDYVLYLATLYRENP